MEIEKNVILVTWDFSEKAEDALEHAVLAGKRLKNKVGLLHIVKKATEIQTATERINGILANKYGSEESKPLVFVKEGNIFTTISETANEMEATMVFMGTHGIKGMQKFLGSWALKVIAHTKVPFVVVQDKPKNDTYKNIVLPVTFRKENKECINWALYFAKHFSSHFHIFKAKHNDPNFIKGIDSNIFFLRKFFTSKGIPFDVIEAKGEDDYVIETIQFAMSCNADALMTVITKDIGFTDYVLGAHEQFIIANEANLPVICINPRPPKFGGSFSASGG